MAHLVSFHSAAYDINRFADQAPNAGHQRPSYNYIYTSVGCILVVLLSYVRFTGQEDVKGSNLVPHEASAIILTETLTRARIQKHSRVNLYL